MAELSKLIGKHSGVRGHTPVFLKLAVTFARVNERSNAFLIIPGGLCIDIVFSWIGQQPATLFLCPFGFEWPPHCYIQWLEWVSAVRWEGTHDSAIHSAVKYCIKGTMAVVIVEKDHNATASFFYRGPATCWTICQTKASF
jgi:hypothetical protein